MMSALTFDAISEAAPGPKWQSRWRRDWPDYRKWFERTGKGRVPDRAACEAALARHMPELVPVHARLTELAGGGDTAARFLSTWCPPPYLAGCSVAAVPAQDGAHLVRNYDLSPELNEGLLLRSEWTGTPVMGMIEFLWGVSDGINERGLAVALAFGGSRKVAEGFGICTILRYVLETCESVADGLAVLSRIPSHMDYNVVLADATGATASVEVHAGGGTSQRKPAIATNHQLHGPLPERAAFTRTVERRAALAKALEDTRTGHELTESFLRAPLFQTDYAGGFGTLFTATYDTARRGMRLVWQDAEMRQMLDTFTEGAREIVYAPSSAPQAPSLDHIIDVVPASRREAARDWLAAAAAGRPDWVRFGSLFWTPEGAPAPEAERDDRQDREDARMAS